MTYLQDTPWTCANFLGTCRDPERCHICQQPRRAHPDDDNSWYWYQWLKFNVLLELATI